MADHKIDYNYADIAKMVDHSLLPPNLTDDELMSRPIRERAFGLKIDKSSCKMPPLAKKTLEYLVVSVHIDNLL